MNKEKVREALVKALNEGDEAKANEIRRRWRLYQESQGTAPAIDDSATPRAAPKPDARKILPPQLAPAGAVVNAALGDAEYDLPDLRDTEVFNETFGPVQDTLNVFRNAETMGKRFVGAANEKTEGGYQYGEDPKGNPIITKGGKPFAYVKQPGMDWRDVRDTAIGVAPYAGTAATVNRLMQGSGRVARALGIGTGEVATNEGIAALTGQDATVADNLLAFTLGSGSEAVGPVIRRLMGTNPLTNENILNAEKRLRELGVDNWNEDTLRLFALNDAKALPPEINEEMLLAMGQVEGMQMTRGTAMQAGPEQQRQLARERGLNEQEVLAEANAQTQRATSDFITQQGQAAAHRSEPEMAQELIELVDHAARTQRDEAQSLYTVRQYADDFGGNETWGFPSLELKLQEVSQKNRFRNLATGEANAPTEAASKVFDTIMGKFGRIKDQGEYTIGDLDDIYRDLNFYQRLATEGGQDSNVIGQMKSEYRDWLDNVAMERLDPESAQTLQELLDASDAWGEYMRLYQNKHGAVNAIIRDIANGDADPERLGRALFGGDYIDLTNKEVANLMNAVRPEDREAMRGVVREGITRRLFGIPRTGRPKENIQDVLKELDALFPRERWNPKKQAWEKVSPGGSNVLLGDAMYPPGSKIRDEMRAIHAITKTLADVDDLSSINRATMENLSALYTRINTPFGLRFVFKIWNAPVEIQRRILGKKYADAANQMTGPNARRIGAPLGAAPIGLNELEPREEAETQR